MPPPMSDSSMWHNTKNEIAAGCPQIAPLAHLQESDEATADSTDMNTAPWTSESVAHPPRPSTPIDYPRKLVTPAGYHLGPYGEGWQSPRSSLSRYRHDFSTPSSARRDNPKTMGFGASLVVPTPKTRPDYDVVAEYQGLKLGRISDAIPYLLGPRSIIDRIQVILEHSHRLLESSSSNYTNPSQDVPQPTYTLRDKALMAILSSIRTPEFVRLEKGDWYPQGLAARYDALLLYKNTASRGVCIVHVTLSDYVEMAQTWLLAPNPANIHGDFPNAKNAWTEVASLLRSKGVDVAKIDMQTYLDLTVHSASDEVAAKTDEIAQWARNGTLDERYQKYIADKEAAEETKRGTKTFHRGTAAQSAKEAVCGGAEALYSKRFTHEYPLGRAAAAAAAAATATATAAPTHHGQHGQHRTREEVEKDVFANAERIRKMEKGKMGESLMNGGGMTTVGDKDTAGVKKRNRAFFVGFMVLLFGGAVGAMLWAMGTRRWDFTAGGETG